MSKLLKRMAIIGIVSLCSATMLTLLLTITHLGQQSAQAYPAPATPIPPMAYPAYQPGSWPPPPTNIIANNPESSEELPYHTFLPIVPFTPKVHFGIAGANLDENSTIITNTGYRIDPYMWGITPWKESQTQMIRRCHGPEQDHWCWIVNDTTCIAYTERCVRTNIADIGTPWDFPPGVSASPGTAKRATDGQYDTFWIVPTNVTSTHWITVDLQPVWLDAITLTWGTLGYAQNYNIQIRPSPTAAWQTIYTENSGDGLTDTITFTNPIFSDDIRLNLTQVEGDGYYLGELEVYGAVTNPFFQRSNPPLADWIAAHPATTWLLGNEPDNFDLGFGDGMTPQSYADFYATVAVFIRQIDPTANIIFCQGTKAQWVEPQPTLYGTPYPQFPYDIGPVYCNHVVPLVEELVPTLDPTLTLSSLVNGVSTHQYINNVIITTTLTSELTQWENHLNDFVGWVDSQPALAGKPLYLTEYGDYDNKCPYPKWVGTRQCGTLEDTKAFWGSTPNAGFFAIQYHTTDYFLSPANTRWVAAWWFYAGDGDDDNKVRAEAYRGGVLQQRIAGIVLNYNGKQLDWAIWCLGANQYCQSPP